jgi:hypothetical protein
VFPLPSVRPASDNALRQDRVHLIAFLRGAVSAMATSVKSSNQPLENAPSDLGMRHLAPAEEDRRLDLVAVSKEAFDVLLLELIVVLVHLGTKLDLFDLDDLLVLLGLPRALLFLVLSSGRSP